MGRVLQYPKPASVTPFAIVIASCAISRIVECLFFLLSYNALSPPTYSRQAPAGHMDP